MNSHLRYQANNARIAEDCREFVAMFEARDPMLPLQLMCLKIAIELWEMDAPYAQPSPAKTDAGPA